MVDDGQRRPEPIPRGPPPNAHVVRSDKLEPWPPNMFPLGPAPFPVASRHAFRPTRSKFRAGQVIAQLPDAARPGGVAMTREHVASN
ncbi:hypothetical protein BHE74_00029563 [Ensete ventricosum]|nr:hypothetical protein BHE74_00029563 [Ensete ventricosum]RZS04656.1 hypothetical protein BHM03_00035023 [Ensete ventricosum]